VRSTAVVGADGGGFYGEREREREREAAGWEEIGGRNKTKESSVRVFDFFFKCSTTVELIMPIV
jgi:hypothetical protein